MYIHRPRKTQLDLAAEAIAQRLGRSVSIYRGTGFVHVMAGGTIIARGSTYARALKAATDWCSEFDADQARNTAGNS